MADGRDIKILVVHIRIYPVLMIRTLCDDRDKVLSEGYKISQGTYLTYTNREPRFYVNIGYSHAWWAMGSNY